MTAHRLLEPTQLNAAPQNADMVQVRGGTFRMGSDRHYREEAPVHRVTVNGFWIDRTPVTNAQFRRFVEETGHVTFAELPPKPEDYPGALPHMRDRVPSSSARRHIRFRSPSVRSGGRTASVRNGSGPMVPAARSRASTITRSCTSPMRTRKPTRAGRARSCRQRPSGSSRRVAAWRMPSSPGATSSCLADARWRTPGRASSHTRTSRHTFTSARRR